jgi:DNA topoisomerase-6 subunit A
LKQEDVTRAEQMKAYPWFKDQKWQREIQRLLDNKFKMEIDGFLTNGIEFLAEEYLPKKLKDRDYLQ